MREEQEKKMNKFLDEIQKRDENKYMDVCYDTIVKFPEQMIEYKDRTCEQKLRSIDVMISHYIERNEFERCKELKDLKTKIEEYHG